MKSNRFNWFDFYDVQIRTRVILPVFATFYTGRGTGWLRESFDLRSDPPEEKEARDYTTTIKLQRGH